MNNQFCLPSLRSLIKLLSSCLWCSERDSLLLLYNENGAVLFKFLGRHHFRLSLNVLCQIYAILLWRGSFWKFIHIFQHEIDYIEYFWKDVYECIYLVTYSLLSYLSLTKFCVCITFCIFQSILIVQECCK